VRHTVMKGEKGGDHDSLIGRVKRGRGGALSLWRIVDTWGGEPLK